MSDHLKSEIEREVAANTILVYGKGTKDAPRCGFTLETIEFFDHFGYPFEVIDVLENMPKREALAEMTDWPTLPKVFINGKFYGDTDMLGPMADKRRTADRAGRSVRQRSRAKNDDQPALADGTRDDPRARDAPRASRATPVVDDRRLPSHASPISKPGAAPTTSRTSGRVLRRRSRPTWPAARTGANGRHPMPDPEDFARFLRSLRR